MKYTAYKNRAHTDAFAPLADGQVSYTGNVDKAIHFVEGAQLLDPALWGLFVEQFRQGNVDDHDLGWRGEYWGKMMRGACFTYRYTQNEKLYEALQGTVKDLLTTQDQLGRIATYSIPSEFHGWDIWSRKYVMLGLEYFLEICKEDDLADSILRVLCKHADYLLEKIGHSEGKTPITHTSKWWSGMNASSILEAFVRLYHLTGLQKYLDFSKEIIEAGGMKGFDMFEAALENKLYPFEYPVTKAYEMMSNFEGILEYYRATGEEKYKTMVVNFAHKVMQSDITVIGSAGTTHELFDHSKVRQFNPAFDGIMQETCVTVTWMKLCWQLLCLTGAPVYADEMERSIYNALLGAVNVNKKAVKSQIFSFDSYSPLLNGFRGREVGGYKDIIRNQFWWGCCVAIGAAGTGIVAGTAHQKAKDGMVVNLYMQGKAKMVLQSGNEIQLNTQTKYPVSGTVQMEMNCQKSETFALYIRIPDWSKETVLKVNGVEQEAQSGTYARIERHWESEDKIELTLDMRTKVLHACQMDAQADKESICHVALQRGPVMLARDAQTGENILEKVTIKEENGYACLEPCAVPFPAQQAYFVATQEGHITVADYASCGQNWDKDMPISVWITTK